MIKAIGTWPSDDVTVELEDHMFVLFERPILKTYQHGYVKKGQIGLTSEEARDLANRLIFAACKSEELSVGYDEEMTKGITEGTEDDP